MEVIAGEQFQRIFPRNKDAQAWADQLDFALFEFGLVEPEQVAMFLAQCGHESADFTRFNENLNYSWEGLRRTFRKYFANDDIAKQYHRQPERIANRVYGNRMGNGPESSGDGWKFRGRGILQVTGKNNYAACSKYLFDSETYLLDDPDVLLEKRESILSALWFWEVNRLKSVTDIVKATRIINGGTNGLQHRTELYQKALEVLRP
jgi:putative chitinase